MTGSPASPSRSEVERKLRAVLDGMERRDAVAAWARQWVGGDEAQVEDDRIWWALQHVADLEAQSDDGIRKWQDELIRLHSPAPPSDADLAVGIEEPKRRHLLRLGLLLCLLPVAGLILASVVLVYFNEPEEPPSIDPAVMRAIEADPGLALTPPGALETSSGSRVVCVDDSGSPPERWREVSTIQAAPSETDAFYRRGLPDEGWRLVDSGNADQAGDDLDFLWSQWTKDIADRAVSLTVDVHTHSAKVVVSASVPC